jgi:hypothetical protein
MTRSFLVLPALFGLAFSLACSEVPTEMQPSDARLGPSFGKGGKPNSRLPSYSADLSIHPMQWGLTNDGRPDYISGDNFFSAGTMYDGRYLLVNFSKGQKRKGTIRRAWINSDCRHLSDEPHTDDCGSELGLEVTDMRAWFAGNLANVEPGTAILHVVDNCAPWNELRFGRGRADIPDFTGTWMANPLSVDPLDAPEGTVRKRKLSTANGNIAWCRDPDTGAEEYWHVDVDFDVTEYE